MKDFVSEQIPSCNTEQCLFKVKSDEKEGNAIYPEEKMISGREKSVSGSHQNVNNLNSWQLALEVE